MEDLKKFKEKQKKLKYFLLNNADFSELPAYIIFSYLGARVCYSSSHPLFIFNEEKFRNPEKFKNFLIHLKRMKHYSIFAHTPIPVRIDKLGSEEKFLLASMFFKVFWPVDEKSRYAIFNLRHLAEVLENEEFEKIISIDPYLKGIEVTVIKSGSVTFKGRLSKVLENLLEKNKNDIFAKQEIIILRKTNENKISWIGVIAHNFSRIFSHQFVRHTWLNFNQRSHRYTSVDRFVVPEVFNKDAVKRYCEIIKKCMNCYKEFFDKGIKREWARFVIPQGCATTVFATGPKMAWKDFVEKRNIPQAQGEIRNFASILQKIIFANKF